MSETSNDTVKKTLRGIYGERRNLVDEALERNREAANAPNPLRPKPVQHPTPKPETGR